MTYLTDFTKRAVIALAVTCVALPAVAFEASTDFAPGGNGPDDPGGGGGAVAIDVGVAAPQGGDRVFGNAPNPCPGGQLIVEFEVDRDGHPIPTSFTRECVLYR